MGGGNLSIPGTFHMQIFYLIDLIIFKYYRLKGAGMQMGRVSISGTRSANVKEQSKMDRMAK